MIGRLRCWWTGLHDPVMVRQHRRALYLCSRCRVWL